MPRDDDDERPKGRRTGGVVDGLIGGLTELIEKLGNLADDSGTIRGGGEFGQGDDKPIKGVYGVSLKWGLGGDKPKAEPFGNVRRDPTSGESYVHETREPMVDVFEEPGVTVVVAELPGISAGDVKLTVEGDVLVIRAASGDKVYGREVLLPQPCTDDGVSFTCNNGIVEIRCRH